MLPAAPTLDPMETLIEAAEACYFLLSAGFTTYPYPSFGNQVIMCQWHEANVN